MIAAWPTVPEREIYAESVKEDSQGSAAPQRGKRHHGSDDDTAPILKGLQILIEKHSVLHRFVLESFQGSLAFATSTQGGAPIARLPRAIICNRFAA